MTIWHQQKRWVFFFDLGPLLGTCDLPEILIGYNTSVHSVTGFTPQRLQTGSEYPAPLMRRVNPPVLEEEEDVATKTMRETREATVRNLRALTNQRV